MPRRRRPSAVTRASATSARVDRPRGSLVLPDGDVLIAETNAPPKSDDNKGIAGWIMSLVMSRAGAGVAERQSHHLATRCRRRVAESRFTLLDGQNSFDMALVGDALYVAATDAVLRFPYGETRITAPAVKSARGQDRRSASSHDQSPLDQESHPEPQRTAPLCHRRLEQQQRCGEWDRSGRRASRHLGTRPRHGRHRIYRPRRLGAVIDAAGHHHDRARIAEQRGEPQAWRWPAPTGLAEVTR
jgi:hypothetical protein